MNDFGQAVENALPRLAERSCDRRDARVRRPGVASFGRLPWSRATNDEKTGTPAFFSSTTTRRVEKEISAIAETVEWRYRGT
jgi:hypothetical protein